MITVLIILVVLALIGVTVVSMMYPDKFKLNIVKINVLGIITIVILMLFNGAFFYGKAGYSYLVQYINGTQVAEMTPGLHFKGWGEVYPFKKFLTVKASSGENEQEDGSAENVSGRIPSVPIRFNDAVLAKVNLSVRFKLPEDKENFKQLALEYRSQENLVNTTLIPAVSESARNAAKKVSAAEYMAGQGTEFDSAILGQLRDGIYILDTRIEKINVPDKEEIGGEETKKRFLDSEEKIKKIVTIRKDKNGNFLTRDAVLKNLHIVVTQAIVDNIDPEDKFKQLLNKQMEASANASIKKEEAKTAEWDRQTIIAKGETEKATIKVEQEKAQIKKLIAAETAQKESKIMLEKSKIDLDKAKIDAQSTKTLADAESYKKRAIYQADGALEKKLATLEKINQYYAEAMKGQPLVPTTVIGGNGQTSSAMDLVNLMTAKTAKDLNLDLNPGK